MNYILKTLALFSLLLFTASTPNTKLYFTNYENVLGTSFELKIEAASEKISEHAEEVALSEIDRLNKILSSYEKTSEVNLWQQTQHVDVPVSKELFEVLALFDQWTAKTKGALNASAAVAIASWKRAASNQAIPSQNELAQDVAAMNKKHWSLDYKNQTARHLTKEPLVLNTFVKSYIINKAAEKVMDIPGITFAVLNIGGDIKISGSQQERIRIANPKAASENDQAISRLALANKAIATSGNYRRGFKIGQEWYSHIVDARTALPVKEIISATVVANNPVDAGALATAFNILTIEESAALAKTIAGAEYLVITKAGDRISSNGWKNLEIENDDKKLAATTTNSEDEEFELLVDFELARFEGRSHRPFVGVWIEDENKESIRNIAVWYNKPKWLHDLKRWYSKHGDSFSNDGSKNESVTGATRSAGKYSLKWDGKDDSGKKVASGKYTIYIEAAREHGTYQLIKKEIEWNNKAAHIDLPGGVEIISASLDYRKVKKD